MIEKNGVGLPCVMVVLVNWNRHRDTLACLDSLRRMDYHNWFAVVCDNGSQDGSVEHFCEWARDGKITYHEYSEEDVGLMTAEIPPCRSLLCLKGTVNRGFAAAGNLALQYALRLETVQYAWLLNNDTVVDPAALAELVHVSLQNTAVGMCGSTVLRLDRPNVVQCLGGGRYNHWLGWTRHVGDGSKWDDQRGNANLRVEVEAQLDYVYGASMLVSRNFLQDIGLMSEEYFLYFEELDWVQRAQGRYLMGYAPNSVIWHKEGGSTLLGDGKKSEIADYYMIRNRVLFTLRYYRKAVLLIFAGLLVTLANRVLRRQIGRIPLVFRAVADGVKTACK